MKSEMLTMCMSSSSRNRWISLVAWSLLSRSTSLRQYVNSLSWFDTLLKQLILRGTFDTVIPMWVLKKGEWCYLSWLSFTFSDFVFELLLELSIESRWVLMLKFTFLKLSWLLGFACFFGYWITCLRRYKLLCFIVLLSLHGRFKLPRLLFCLNDSYL